MPFPGGEISVSDNRTQRSDRTSKGVTMAFVRTILGDVDPASLGVVNCHDHLIRVGAGA